MTNRTLHLWAIWHSSSASYSSWLQQKQPQPQHNEEVEKDSISDIIQELAQKQPTPISLQMLLQTGCGKGDFWGTTRRMEHSQSYWGTTLRNHHSSSLADERIWIQMATYLRHELPVRLAHRIQDLSNIGMFSKMPAVQHVRSIYVHSFTKLVQFPKHIANAQEEHQFAQLLTTLYQNHQRVLVQMAKGAYQLREQIRKQQQLQQHTTTTTTTTTNPFIMNECREFLDRFYMSRIGIRFLAGQYLALRNPPQSSYNHHPPSIIIDRDSYIGMICKTTSPADCVRLASNDAKMMCRRAYGRCPNVEIDGRWDLTFPYIPTYLHYILLEILKNALRATMERHLHADIVPPVQVIIADDPDNEDVVIRISDEGGGIPRSQMDNIWSYLFTTADPKIQERFLSMDDDDDSEKKTAVDHSNQSPIAGLGYGLPISRSYCRYFGGDLDLISMEGYGTDAFVHLKRLGDSKEPVPV
jgi:pyruvate dehydrogenase kinase 2/3/4